MFSLEGLLNLFFFWILVKTFCDLVDNFWPKCQALILCVQRIFLGEIFWEASERNYLVLEFMRKFSKFLADKFKQVCRSCILQVQREIWRIKRFPKKNISKTSVRLTIKPRQILSKVHSTCAEKHFQWNHDLLKKPWSQNIFQTFHEKFHQVVIFALYVTTGKIFGKIIKNATIKVNLDFWRTNPGLLCWKFRQRCRNITLCVQKDKYLKSFSRNQKGFMNVFVFSAEFLWTFRENFSARISNLHHRFPGKKVKEEALVEILGSILKFYSEQQVSGFLEGRLWPTFHY